MSGTTLDTLLDGRVRLHQPARGYRAAIDPVLLAAFVPARAGQHVLEGGLGVGAAALCLVARVPGCSVTGIELVAETALLARRNALANGCEGRLAVIEGDVLELRSGQFDHAMANPPFQPHGSGTIGVAAAADRESAPEALPNWIAALARRVQGRGTLSLVLPAARLSESLAACRDAGLGAILVLPVAPRPGETATRILLRGTKSARGGDRLLAPLVLHGEGQGFSAAAEAVLRRGEGLATD
jgi:tRNA1(Val) A37 N6-methylase TrmN6